MKVFGSFFKKNAFLFGQVRYHSRPRRGRHDEAGAQVARALAMLQPVP